MYDCRIRGSWRSSFSQTGQRSHSDSQTAISVSCRSDWTQILRITRCLTQVMTFGQPQSSDLVAANHCGFSIGEQTIGGCMDRAGSKLITRMSKRTAVR